MRPLVISTLVFIALVAAVRGAAMLESGDCPDGLVPGDSWELPGCATCDCGEGYYRCLRCGSFHYDKKSCYLVDNSDKKYPKCCNPDLKCRGQEGFDESQLRPDSQPGTDVTDVTDEPLIFVDPAVTDKPVIYVDPTVTDEPVIYVDPTVTEEPVTVVDPTVTEEPVIYVDPTFTDEPVTVVDHTVIEEPVTVLDPTITEEPVIYVDPPVTDEPVTVVDPTITEEPVTVVDPAVTGGGETVSPEEVTDVPSVIE